MDKRAQSSLTGATLIACLETWPTGDAALSAAVLQAIGWQWEPFGCPGNGLWRTPSGNIHTGPLPAVTELAEAARGLLAAHVHVAAAQHPVGQWSVSLFTHPLLSQADYRDPVIAARGHTLPLALCSAIVQLSKI